MGRILTKIKVENLFDLLLVERGELAPDQVRQIELEALVDTGATLLCLPAERIRELGLSLFDTRPVTTAAGTVQRRVFHGARLTIMGRTCTTDVIELTDAVPALLGYVPLEVLDLKVDPRTQNLVPDRGDWDKIVLDLFVQISHIKQHPSVCP